MLKKIASTYIKENTQNIFNKILDSIKATSTDAAKAFYDGYSNIGANDADSGHQRALDEGANLLGWIFQQNKSYTFPKTAKLKK